MESKKSMLITASSGGLGRSFAIFFAKKGYDILLHGREEEKIKNTKKDLETLGAEVWVVKGDLREEETINTLYKESRKRDISILINNAAIPSPGLPLDELPQSIFEELLATNLYSRLKLTKKVYSFFKEKKEGIVITINSILGREFKKYKSIHSAAVWGLRGFSNSLRIEAKDNGVRVMSVYPTKIKTRPEYTYGMESEFVAQKIYDSIINNGPDELILDGRPPEFRPKVIKDE